MADKQGVLMNNNGQIQSLDLQSLSQLPLAQYYRYAENFVNVENVVYYDSAVYTAGTAVTSAMKRQLFKRGKSEADTVVNTGVAIAEKGEYMTNMISNGEFEGGNTFILEQIGVFAQLTSELPTTLGARGEITAPNYTASVVISAANNLKAYLEQIHLEFRRAEQLKLTPAPLFMWPSPFGMTGAIGSPNAGFVQNGGYGIQLARPIVLGSEDPFSFTLQPNVATFTPTIGINIRVMMIGKAVRTLIP